MSEDLLADQPPGDRRDDPELPAAAVRATLQIFEDLGKDLKTDDRAWTRVKTN